MINLADDLKKIANDMAKQHYEIIENELKQIVEIFKCDPKDITMKIHQHRKYEILVKVKEFEIDNKFTWGSKND